MSENRPLPRSCAVYSRARPRRVAFLVSPDDLPPELIDDLFTFNYEHWGGRFNPIIPVVNGHISESYWSLLTFTDPDVIYTYVALHLDEIRRFERGIHPWSIEKHPQRPENVPHRFYPYIGPEQVEAYAVWSTFFKQERIVLFQPPRLLTFGADLNWPALRPILRNFGLMPENLARKPYPETQERISIQNDWTEERVFEQLSTIHEIIFPFVASFLMTPFPEPSVHNRYDYCLVIGDEPWEWIYFWNRVFLLSDYRRNGWHTLCISPEKQETRPPGQVRKGTVGPSRSILREPTGRL